MRIDAGTGHRVNRRSCALKHRACLVSHASRTRRQGVAAGNHSMRFMSLAIAPSMAAHIDQHKMPAAAASHHIAWRVGMPGRASANAPPRRQTRLDTRASISFLLLLSVVPPPPLRRRRQARVHPTQSDYEWSQERPAPGTCPWAASTTPHRCEAGADGQLGWRRYWEPQPSGSAD